MKYEERWYLCQLEDSAVDEVVEPDWSKVPEFKREVVRAKWLEAHKPQPYLNEVFLWGPQIDFFARQPYYKVIVLERDVA